MLEYLKNDPEILEVAKLEINRQETNLELIASENFVSLAVLEAAGSSMDKVLKTTVFMKDLNDYTAINDIYKEFFSHKPPARSAIQAARLPRDAGVEIEVIAFCG